MVRCCLLVSVFLLLLFPSLHAQRPASCDVRVRVTYPDNHPVGTLVHVRLMAGASSSALADGYTNSEGQAEFHSVPEGNYNVVVSGEGIEETNSAVFKVDPGRASEYVDVRVRRLTQEAIRTSTPVSVADLKVPEAAARQFDKAVGLIAKEDFQKAIHFLRKALSIYPRYAAAYNNLGVVYARLGQPAEERSALLKAVELNDHFAAAYANLGRLAIKQGNYRDAERWLGQATTADPADAQVLIMLANIQLINQHYQDALSNCRKLHATQADSHALAHYIAGRALALENHPAEAVSELETFLKEDPSGARVDAARREITQLQGRITAASR
jgi:tetratricopeptide (TPR) repeat protein